MRKLNVKAYIFFMLTVSCCFLVGAGAVEPDRLLASDADPTGLFGPIPDPALLGPFEVTREEYTLSNVQLSGPRRVGTGDFVLTSEVIGSVHAPTDLSAGPLPVVVFLHGRFCTCRVISCTRWPCPENEYWSYKGYDYVSEILASWGYIVISVSANAINSTDDTWRDLGGNERAQLVLHHLDQWKEFNTTGGEPFGDRFIGKLNLDNIGLMGHSRGGEGVTRVWFCNQNPDACNLQRDNTFTFSAVLTLAPTTNFYRTIVTNVPYGTILPYCDGDVFTLNGERNYDDARYALADDPTAKQHVLVMGANHDGYNRIWEFNDDWTAFRDRSRTDPYCVPNIPTTGRLSLADQRATAIAYISSFMRIYVGNEFTMLPLWTGDAPPPGSINGAEVHFAYHPADLSDQRLDVDRVTSDTSLTTNFLGGAVSQTGLNPFVTCVGTLGCNAPIFVNTSRVLRIGWDDTSAQYQSQIPSAFRDVSQYSFLSFRPAVKGNDPRNPAGQPQDLSVVLIDGSGQSAAVRVSDYSANLYFPPGGPLARKEVLNSVRIPLGAFTGVSLGNIQTIRFNYDQTSQGSLFINDLMFAQ
ncbi:MAG: hypothetical protein HYR55_14695 [Acidobacteria bacterium]|nr:hypothetical protein [Acidobacteriota bacterium]MBI3655900.1 hypothetical protein [Acidobacteriota bacterium]